MIIKILAEKSDKGSISNLSTKAPTHDVEVLALPVRLHVLGVDLRSFVVLTKCVRQTRIRVDRAPGLVHAVKGIVEPEPDFSAESTSRGGGCPDGPSKQAVGLKIVKMLAKSCQNFINFQKFLQISKYFDEF